MNNRSGRRFGRGNLIWVAGVAAGLVAGAVVAYGLAGPVFTASKD